MESLFASTRGDLPRYRQCVRAFALRGSGFILGSLAAFATSASELPRFQLVGTGTLTLDLPMLKSGNVQVKATLTPIDAAVVSSPPVQEGGRFALMADLSTASLVCYNDTIFRDGFDGTGL
jgi:hypothetical protein